MRYFPDKNYYAARNRRRSGIGEAAARFLASCGVRIDCQDGDTDRLEALAKEIADPPIREQYMRQSQNQLVEHSKPWRSSLGQIHGPCQLRSNH